jgi:hypothetical protein
MNMERKRLFIKELEIESSGNYKLKISKQTFCSGEFKVAADISIPNVEHIHSTDDLIFNVITGPKEFLKYSNLSKTSFPLGYFYQLNEIEKL